LKINASKALPDIILIDLGSDAGGGDMYVMFIKVVATDGPINRERKLALTSLALEANFSEHHLSFMTACMDRANAPFRKSITELPWGSYAWCMSEPNHIIELREGEPRKLFDVEFAKNKI
jgi:hypothetical protein